MNFKSSIVPFILRCRPYFLGFISGMFISIIIVGLNAMKDPRVEYLAPAPFTDSASNSVVHQMMLYGKEGGITTRTARYYYRGTDWIMIKDFGLNIDNYEGDFKDISDLLWNR